MEDVAHGCACCDAELYGAILAYRARLAMQTQDIEGRNSKLQGFFKKAPNLSRAAANARMRHAYGAPITAKERTERPNT